MPLNVYLVSDQGADLPCPPDSALLRFIPRETDPDLQPDDLCVIYLDGDGRALWSRNTVAFLLKRGDYWDPRKHVMSHLKARVSETFDWSHTSPVRKVQAHRVTDELVDLNPTLDAATVADLVLDVLKSRGFDRVPQKASIVAWAAHRADALRVDAEDES